MRLIGESLFRALSSEAIRSPRKRLHLNFHDSYEEPFQRLLNALEPESYIRPHRHLFSGQGGKTELFLAVRGSFLLVLFSEQGAILEAIEFGAGKEILGMEVPPESWHTILALTSGSVLFEAKPGPFSPAEAKDCAPWAPSEDDREAAARYLEALRQESLKRVKLEART